MAALHCGNDWAVLTSLSAKTYQCLHFFQAVEFLITRHRLFRPINFNSRLHTCSMEPPFLLVIIIIKLK